SRRRHTRSKRDWSSDVCSSDLGIVDAGDLGGLHLNLGVFLQVDDGGGVHDLLAQAVALAVVLFHIAEPGVFAHKEGVDAVMPGRSEERRVGKEVMTRSAANG